jgi:hypothetical protein
MPRKRRLTHLSISDIPVIDPKDRNAVDDHDLVRHALVDFDEVAVLPPDIHERLVEDLAAASRIARGGIKAGKRHVSNKAMGKHIFMFDVRRAMGRAGLPTARWRHDHEGRESLYYRLAHALSDVFDLNLPQDLGPLAEWAEQIQYGEMSPAMKAAQLEELVAQGRRRLDQLAVRLAAQDAERVARRRLRAVWGDHLADPPRTCEELASAYLGFPF